MDIPQILDGLNDEQRTAVTHEKGPLMIVAGAGTGKTTALTRRIAWLIASGAAKPEEILALTFTDKAAGEMEERVDRLLPFGYVDLHISTFHSFCERLLREFGTEIGLSRDFRPLSDLDAWLMVRRQFDRFDLTHYRPRGNPTRYLRGLLEHFSRLKDDAVGPDDYLAFAEGKEADLDAATSDEEATAEVARVRELADAYHAYERILLEQDALDFGGLIVFALKLLRERPGVLAQVRARFPYVLVDEFQDTNPAQYELVKLIAAPCNNLTVVGDDDQSIYRFRGASVENILAFEEDYPDAKRVVLSQNYRSGQEILDRAHAFIQHNDPNRLEVRLEGELTKKLVSRTGSPGEVAHIHATTVEEEAARVARKIVELKEADPDADWNDFGILVRSNDAATPFLAALEARRVPFQFLALKGLYAKPAVLDLSAILRIIDSPYESPSVYRYLTHPMHGISMEAVAALSQLARRKGKSLYEAAGLAHASGDIPPEELGRIDRAVHAIDRLRAETRRRKLSELFILAAKETGLVAHVNGLKERERQDGFKHTQALFERVRGYESRTDGADLKGFLEEFAHERDAGEEGALSPDLDAGPDMVRVMTVHASKGLEFGTVFVVSLVDRRFPTDARGASIPLPEGLLKSTAKDSAVHLEEERRLFYVAVTRAKERLFLCSAEDYGGARKRKPSRFLTEIGFEKPSVAADPAPDGLPELPSDEPSEGGLVVHLPKQFSFTQLTAFRTCPLQYKFAHILKIPVFGKWTFSFGKTMHNTLQAYFTHWIERTGARQETLFDPPSGALADDEPPVSKAELLELYERHWIDDWYADDAQREEYRKKGRESLTQYFAQLEADPPRPLFLEQGFTLKFGDIVLKGRIDRVDAADGGVEVIDYKTGRPKTEKELKKEDKEQLLLYQLAARDILGLTPVRLTFHYLEDNSRASFLGSDEDLLKLQEEIVDRVARIRESRFAPTPGFHCKFCDFADICEFRKA